jgi:hypothetical protein
MVAEVLVAEAVKAAIGALTKEATGSTLAAGGRILAWLKSKLAGTGAQAVIAAAEAEPSKISVQLKLSGVLAELLETQTELVAELDHLLTDSGYRDIATQTANVSGNQNTIAQTSGQGNRIIVGRG